MSFVELNKDLTLICNSSEIICNNANLCKDCMDLICWTGQARLANIMILKAISKQVKTEFSDMNYDTSSQDFVKASVLISLGAESLP